MSSPIKIEYVGPVTVSTLTPTVAVTTGGTQVTVKGDNLMLAF